MMNFKLLTLIESVLGKGRSTNKGNVAFHCPFCHHNKKKLEVNILSQHWHCWVCNAAGRKIVTLFKKLKVERYKISKLFEFLEETEYRPKITTTNTKAVELPKEFTPREQTLYSFIYNHTLETCMKSAEVMRCNAIVSAPKE